MLFFTAFVAFSSFPESKDAIFANSNKNNIKIETSGSLGLYHYDVKQCLKANRSSTLTSVRSDDWCSDIGKKGTNPYIQYSINEKSMKLTKYAVRNGCCDYSACSTEGNRTVINKCCCYLYSFSLRGSNDNKTWVTLHSVSKADRFYPCLYKTFQINSDKSFYKYIRFTLDEEHPSCNKCVLLNQIELYGATANLYDLEDAEIDDENSISIIGRVRNN